MRHETVSGEYKRLVLAAPLVAAEVKPGQFVHLRVPHLDSAVLRRPFSVFAADGGALSILYKQVGRGTRAMADLECGREVGIIGPLGNGFPIDSSNSLPVLVAGGYGVAPLLFLATRLPVKGHLFVGGATARDILFVDEFDRSGWETHVSTEDGSAGMQGLVTGALDSWLDGCHAEGPPEFYVCGPDGMLMAVGDRAEKNQWSAWLSLDVHMGCGVGACLACVRRIRMSDGTEVLKRVCRDGPVFQAREVVWETASAAASSEEQP